MLTTEPSLVEPEPVEIKYRILVLNSSKSFAGELFETREEAIDFILEDVGLEILEVQQHNSRS
tara:strand:+ start:667 stop:855 length:189 start_codon:yes stop_codon:yes gene_type:complete